MKYDEICIQGMVWESSFNLGLKLATSCHVTCISIVPGTQNTWFQHLSKVMITKRTAKCRKQHLLWESRYKCQRKEIYMEKILKSNGCMMEPLNRCCWFLRFQLASSALSNPRSANLPEGYTLVGWKTRIRHGFLRILSYQWKAPSSWHSSWRLLSHSGFWWPPSSPVAECVDG